MKRVEGRGLEGACVVRLRALGTRVHPQFVNRALVARSRSPQPFAISPQPSRQRGYTLIEVVVAFGVLALALTLLLGTLSGATRQVRDADLAGRAALHAQSLLDQVGVGEVLQPGVREGEFERGRYRWMLTVAPYRDAAQAAQPLAVAQPELMQLLLTVQWGEDPRRERLQLRTLRLVAPDAIDGLGQVP